MADHQPAICCRAHALGDEAKMRDVNARLLRQAILNVRDQDPADYLEHGDEADAVVAEYERLTR